MLTADPKVDHREFLPRQLAARTIGRPLYDAATAVWEWAAAVGGQPTPWVRSGGPVVLVWQGGSHRVEASVLESDVEWTVTGPGGGLWWDDLPVAARHSRVEAALAAIGKSLAGKEAEGGGGETAGQ